MALHGDRTLAELHKKHICHIGNTVYNISPLLTPQNNVRRDVYLENVREKMVLVQICPTCNNGPCDPDSHKFQESEYQLPDESQNFTAAMASLLSQSGFSPAFTSGGTNFLGGDSTDFETLPDTDQTRRDILAVANRYINGSNDTVVRRLKSDARPTATHRAESYQVFQASSSNQQPSLAAMRQIQAWKKSFRISSRCRSPETT